MSFLWFESVWCSFMQDYLQWRLAEIGRCASARLTLVEVKVPGVCRPWEIWKVDGGRLVGFLCVNDYTWIAEEEQPSGYKQSWLVKLA